MFTLTLLCRPCRSTRPAVDRAKNGLQYYILDYSIYAKKRGICDANREAHAKTMCKKVCVFVFDFVRECEYAPSRLQYDYFTRSRYFFQCARRPMRRATPKRRLTHTRRTQAGGPFASIYRLQGFSHYPVSCLWVAAMHTHTLKCRHKPIHSHWRSPPGST